MEYFETIDLLVLTSIYGTTICCEESTCLQTKRTTKIDKKVKKDKKATVSLKYATHIFFLCIKFKWTIILKTPVLLHILLSNFKEINYLVPLMFSLLIEGVISSKEIVMDQQWIICHSNYRAVSAWTFLLSTKLNFSKLKLVLT